jgi:hypothetical protein
VTLNVLKIAVPNRYAIAMRGKQGPRVKDINGGFNTIETQSIKQDHSYVEMIIQDKINNAMREMHINAGQTNQTSQGVGSVVGHGLMQCNMGRYREMHQ